MRTDKFLNEVCERLQRGGYDDIRSAEKGVITDSEMNKNVIVAFAEMLGVDTYIRVTEQYNGPELEYYITFDDVASQPEECHWEDKPYVVALGYTNYAVVRHGYNNAVDACEAAAYFYDDDEQYGLATVFRRTEEDVANGKDGTKVMWCSSDEGFDYDYFVEDDDPDYEAVINALKGANYIH